MQARSLDTIDEELENMEAERQIKERDREMALRKQSKLKEDVSEVAGFAMPRRA